MIAMPQGWRLAALADLGHWYGGGTPSKARDEFWSNGSIPWLSPKDMGQQVIQSTQDHVTALALSGSAARLVPAGSVAIVVRSGILERTLPIAVVPFETTLNQDMKALTPDEDVDPRWIAWGLRWHERQILQRCRKSGTTVASLDTKRLLAELLPLPSLDEQLRILEILENHLSRLEAASDLLGVALRRRGRLRAALGDDLLKHGWPTAPVADVADFVTDGDHNPPKRVANGVPHITAKCIRDGEISLTRCTYVSEEGYRQTAKRYAPAAGDIIVTCVGTIGAVAVVPKGLRISADRNLAGIRLDLRRALPAFVALVLDGHHAQQEMKNASSSTAQPHLYLKDLRKLMVPLPSLAVQQSVVDTAEAWLGQALATSLDITANQRRARLLRQALFEAAFGGHLRAGTGTDHLVEELANG
jgi:type I restriction enzyme, S subunit